jgi:elongation factor P hydroxylase
LNCSTTISSTCPARDYPDVVPVGGREPIKTRTADGEAAVMRKVWADGFYVSMDRNGINKLIRNLRRARDQAFGRDE